MRWRPAGGAESDLAHDGADATRALTEARRIFTGLTRRGFEPIGDSDDPRLDAFRLAAGALVCMANLIRRMIAALDAVEKKAAPGLGPWFDQDRDRFRRQFTKLYGARR